MRFLGAGIAFAMVLAAADPFAQQAPADSFMVYGAGTASCRSWTDHLSDRSLHPLDAQWVFGFVSAAGVFAGIQLKADANAIEPFMTKYCQDHPADTITTAAASLVGNLR
jgi:hypothetical protein